MHECPKNSGCTTSRNLVILTRTRLDTLIYGEPEHHPEFAGLGGAKRAANSDGPDILAPIDRSRCTMSSTGKQHRAMSDPYSPSGLDDNQTEAGMASLRNPETLSRFMSLFLPPSMVQHSLARFSGIWNFEESNRKV